MQARPDEVLVNGSAPLLSLGITGKNFSHSGANL